MKKVSFFWNELTSTFWFIPVLILFSSVLLSMIMVYLDSIFIFDQKGVLRYFMVDSSDSARSILTTISGAMIGVAGTVFSVTLVALTLASSQFGSRLIRNFMYVRLNQVVLGSYISTYLYSLLILNSVKEVDGYVFIPSLSILVAILAAAANIVLLIIFIHQIAISIQADHIISDISDFISKQVNTLFPEKMGMDEKHEDKIDVQSFQSKYSEVIKIKSPKNGYLQYVDSKSLMDIVTKKNGLLELDFRPGGYLVEGLDIGKFYFNGETNEDIIKDIAHHFVIGKAKTAQQDLEYSIHQMVEIAVRALSPGINDPYTAITCIDNLTATMCYLTQAKFPGKFRFDEENELRIIADAIDFKGVLDAAFNQIRQFSGGSTAVIIRLMEALITIYSLSKKEKHKEAVIKHADMVLSIGKLTIKEKNDIEDLTRRSNKILP